MPEMDGFTASRQIREYENQQGLSRTSIVALTADIKKGIEAECVESGMDGYLSKPFSQSKLAELLNQWLIPDEPAAEFGSEATAAAHQKEKVLDSDVLQELRSLSETTGRDILGNSVRFFLRQTPEDVSDLHQAATELDLERLRKTAHSLKSSSANLGALGFSNLCQQLEDSAREQRTEAVSEQLLAIEALLPRVLLELRQAADVDGDSDFDHSEALQPPQKNVSSGAKSA